MNKLTTTVTRIKPLRRYSHKSVSEKPGAVHILKEADQIGTTATIRKHGIYSNTFYGWRQRYELYGLDGLSSPRLRIDPELKRLQLENQRLKAILADKELEIRVKDELLKKTAATRRTNV